MTPYVDASTHVDVCPRPRTSCASIHGYVHHRKAQFTLRMAPKVTVRQSRTLQMLKLFATCCIVIDYVAVRRHGNAVQHAAQIERYVASVVVRRRSLYETEHCHRNQRAQ